MATICSGCATGQTGAPRTISESGAVIPGKVVSDAGGDVEYWVEYGPTTAYGAESPHNTIATERNAVTSVEVSVTGLTKSTTYHYRVCARDGSQTGGPGCGQDRKLTTQSFYCQQEVTSDVKLTGNLDCGLIGGPVVGADGIDINLAGHQMFGEFTLFSTGVGIANDGYDDVTIRNGTVRFPGGINLENADRNRIIGVRLRPTPMGVQSGAVLIADGADDEIRNSDLAGAGGLIYGRRSTGLVIAGSTLTSRYGAIDLSVVDQARIVRNRIVHAPDSTGVVSGIRTWGNNGRIADNQIEGGWTGAGIEVEGTGNVAVDNVVRGSVLPTTVQSELAGDGIFVGQDATGTVLRRNRAEQNQGDGIQVLTPSARLADNAAFFNLDWGIDAVAGVTDLGGNTAGGNGQAAQCRNVFCP
jgi:hypothetical protein